jgi:hypothetical protein
MHSKKVPVNTGVFFGEGDWGVGGWGVAISNFHSQRAKSYKIGTSSSIYLFYELKFP